MRKKENLEKICNLAHEAGLSSKEVAEYLSAHESEASSAPKVYETSAEIVPGMFVYADNTISSEIVPECPIKAIVGYVEDNTVYAVCLKRVKLPWSSDGLRAERTAALTDGKEATRKILEVVRKTKKQAEAAQFCYDYAENGVKQGEAFLPSMDELVKLNIQAGKVNDALIKLGLSSIFGWLSSSNEYDFSRVNTFNLSSCVKDVQSKGKLTYVVPMLKIQL